MWSLISDAVIIHMHHSFKRLTFSSSFFFQSLEGAKVKNSSFYILILSKHCISLYEKYGFFSKKKKKKRKEMGQGLVAISLLYKIKQKYFKKINSGGPVVHGMDIGPKNLQNLCIFRACEMKIIYRDYYPNIRNGNNF